VIGDGKDCTQFVIYDHYDACRLVEFLASEAAWFEFVPDVDDKYIVAVQPHMADVVGKRLNQWHVFVEIK